MAFIPLESWGFFKLHWSVRVLIIAAIVLGSFLSSIVVLILRSKKVLWRNGNFSIVAEYGDLLKTAFPKKPSKKDKIIVIPVNDAFDTIVDEPGPMALVSSNTIHGRFLEKLFEKHPRDDVDQKINSALLATGYVPKKIIKNKGNTELYPLGTVIPLQFDDSKQMKVSYALLAISQFDAKNNAHSSEQIILHCLQTLTRYLNQVSQGCDVYIPLMGTGESRADFSDKKALDTLEGFFIAFGQECHCNIHIVVYKKKRASLSIFE